MPKRTERHDIVRDILKSGMSKEELAGKMGVSVFTVVRWSKIERTPSFASFYLLKKIHRKVEPN